MNTILKYSFAALFALLAAVPAFAQVEKPDPTPIKPLPPNEPNIAKWKLAYELAKSPKILVLVGIAGNKREASQIGGNLYLEDGSSDTFILKSEIENILLKNDDAEIINLDALNAALAREKEQLRQSNERQAIQLLANKVSAQLVLLVRLQPSKDKGVIYRGTFEGIDTIRANTLSTVGFDWKGGVSAREIKAYANDLIWKFIEDYSAKYITSTGTIDEAERKIRLTLVGVPNESLKDIRDQFKKVAGVRKVSDREADTNFQSGTRETVSEFDIKYTGETLDLSDALRKAAASVLSQFDVREDVRTINTIKLVARPKAVAGISVRPKLAFWQELLDETSGGDGARKALNDAYKQKGSPRIILLINREPSLDEVARYEAERKKSDASSQPVNPSNLIMVVNNSSIGGGSGASVEPAVSHSGPSKAINADELYLNFRKFENFMLARLELFGLKALDPGTVRNVLQKLQMKAGIFEDGELQQLLKQQDSADILVYATGRIDKIADGSFGLNFSFRAVRVKNGEIAATVPHISNSFASGFGIDEMIQTFKGTADESSARLAERLYYGWSPPATMKVTVKNAKSIEDRDNVGLLLKTHCAGKINIEPREFDAGREGGIGTFDLYYTCTYAEFSKSLGELREKNLPVHLMVEQSNEGMLTIRIENK